MSADRDPFFYRIKSAQRELIARCGGIERAAAVAGLSVAQMGRLNAVGESDLMSLRVKARLEAQAGEPIVSRCEIEHLGWSCAPAEAPLACGALASATATVISEASDVMAAHAAALEDGRVTPAEAEIIARELADLARAVETARLSSAALMARGHKEGQ